MDRREIVLEKLRNEEGTTKLARAVESYDLETCESKKSVFKMNRHTSIFFFCPVFKGDNFCIYHDLILLHSEQPKLCRVLAVLSAIGLIRGTTAYIISYAQADLCGLMFKSTVGLTLLLSEALLAP